jgi:broad specificity phosphatase PhoE
VSLRLLLLRHAPTEQTRDGVFGDDGGLSARGLEQSAALAGHLPRADRASRSPARAAEATAAALDLDAAADPALADWDFGRWRGRTLEEVQAEEPDGARAWIGDPGAAPHGGERLVDVLARAAAWLDDQSGGPSETRVAITHAATVRACVVAALGAPPEAFWSLDVAPLSVTELHSRGADGWRISYVNREPARGR